MSSDWPEVRVEEIAANDPNALSTGPFGSSISSKFFTSSGVPVIRGSNLSADVGVKLIDEEIAFVSFDKAKEFRRSVAKRGDLVFTCWGTINQVGLIHAKSKYPEYVVSNKQMKLTVDATKVDPKFLYYVFSSPEKQHEILSNGIGAAVPGFNLGQLKKHAFRLPPLAVQESVVRVLDSLDAKIGLNRRINQTLEAMAQAIFQSWFVDFDPVKAKIAAKAEGRDPLRAAMSAISGKPDAELDALPPEQYEQLAATAALFPDEMEASELGDIPKGWAFRPLADITQFASGKTEVSSLTEDLYISTENMLENRAGITRANSLPSVAVVPSFKAGQILVSNIRPYFKKLWIARFNGGRSPDVLAFEPTDYQWAEFAYNLMYQDAFFEFMTRTAKGAKMPRGDKDAIMGWRFPCPDGLLMIAFSENVRPNYAHIASLNSQNRSLSELRDTLLPKLLSGELSVEALAESAGAA
ncbi:restriction endonuclease subunit S [Hylemonella sp. W303a]|uniref:restriction endonuclease subunit S n=1 Tax=Hylemonella sp. W303a TaxID=3389873 RepID=UPI00396B41CE